MCVANHADLSSHSRLHSLAPAAFEVSLAPSNSGRVAATSSPFPPPCSALRSAAPRPRGACIANLRCHQLPAPRTPRNTLPPLQTAPKFVTPVTPTTKTPTSPSLSPSCWWLRSQHTCLPLRQVPTLSPTQRRPFAPTGASHSAPLRVSLPGAPAPTPVPTRRPPPTRPVVPAASAAAASSRRAWRSAAPSARVMATGGRAGAARPQSAARRPGQRPPL